MTHDVDASRSHRPLPLIPLWLALPLAGVAAIGMDTAFPAVAFWPAAFLSTALLLLALIGRSIGGALGVGLVYGGVFYALLVSWTSRYLGPLPWLALTAAEAAITGVLLVTVALAYRWLGATKHLGVRLVALPALIGALWVLRELVLGSWPYGGFPWARLGMTQSESPLATVTSWAGVSGLSFLIVFTIALIVEIVRLGVWRRPLFVAVPVVLAGLMVAIPAFPTSVVGTMRIGAVQGNGPTGYFDDRTPYAVITAQTDATEPLIGEELDLVVWPEGSLDADPFQNAEIARRLSALSAALDAPLLVNRAVEDEGRYFNTSLLWGTAEGLQRHSKRHPVPFGEYIPDRAFYRLFVPHLVDLVQREYSPGTDPPLMTVGAATIGLAICFDVIYDDVIREGVRGGAEVLILQTNNADFRGTDENLQQLAFARMRAIETGRWVVNISTVGTSQIIAPDGATIASLDSDIAGALLETVELRRGATPGVLLGPWIEGALIAYSLAGLILAAMLVRRRRRAEDS